MASLLAIFMRITVVCSQLLCLLATFPFSHHLKDPFSQMTARDQINAFGSNGFQLISALFQLFGGSVVIKTSKFASDHCHHRGNWEGMPCAIPYVPQNMDISPPPWCQWSWGTELFVRIVKVPFKNVCFIGIWGRKWAVWAVWKNFDLASEQKVLRMNIAVLTCTVLFCVTSK